MTGTMGLEDPPPITEDDINKGMISLLNKGIIPKDVDLTPAFEKGAPPVTCKGVRFYQKEEKYQKRDVQVGGTQTHSIKYDLQPIQEYVSPYKQTRQIQKSPKPLALMPPEQKSMIKSIDFRGGSTSPQRMGMSQTSQDPT